MSIERLVFISFFFFSLSIYGQEYDAILGGYYFNNTSLGEEITVVDSGVESYFPEGVFFTYTTTTLINTSLNFKITYVLEGYGDYKVVNSTIETKLHPDYLKIYILEDETTTKLQRDFMAKVKESFPYMKKDFLNVLKQKIIFLDKNKLITQENYKEYSYRRIY